MGHDCNRYADGPALHQLLDEDGRRPEIQSRAAIVRRQAHAEKAKFTKLFEQLAWNLPIVFPLDSMGRNFAFDK